MAKTNQIGLKCFSYGAKIAPENLLIFNEIAWKPSIVTKWALLYLFSVELEGWQKLGGNGNIKNCSRLGGADKLKQWNSNTMYLIALFFSNKMGWKNRLFGNQPPLQSEMEE